MSKCAIVPNFAAIGQSMIEISRFFYFSRWRPPPSWIFKFQLFKGRSAEEGRTASPCQIWSKSAIPRPRYGDYSIFQDGGRRHLGFFNFQIFNGQTVQERRTASPCQIWWKSAKTRPRYGDFSRWRPSAILDLLCVCWDHPRRAFGGLYRCAKFGWNRCCSFDNMHVF